MKGDVNARARLPPATGTAQIARAMVNTANVNKSTNLNKTNQSFNSPCATMSPKFKCSLCDKKHNRRRAVIRCFLRCLEGTEYITGKVFAVELLFELHTSHAHGFDFSMTRETKAALMH